MKQRLLVAAVGVPALLVILLALPPVATTVLVCLIAGIAAYELHAHGLLSSRAPLSMYSRSRARSCAWWTC